MEKENVVLCWSGGKDSAMALYELRRSERYEVVALLTTVAAEYDRVSHHGVRADLLRRQAAAVGLPLQTLHLAVTAPDPCRPDGDADVMGVYEQLMREALLGYQRGGVR